METTIYVLVLVALFTDGDVGTYRLTDPVNFEQCVAMSDFWHEKVQPTPEVKGFTLTCVPVHVR